MGDVFTPLCQLWSIAQEVIAVYSPQKVKEMGKWASVAFAESKYQKLLKWLDTLPSEMQRTGHEEDHVILLQWVKTHIHLYLYTCLQFIAFFHTSSSSISSAHS
jgi:hypothetical protein